jgi:hypothetical protein
MMIKSKRHSRRSSRPTASQRPAMRNVTLGSAFRAADGLSIALTFDSPVVGTELPTGIRYRETPAGTLHTPSSVRICSETLYFSAAVPETGAVVVPAYDPAIRTRSGGYVNAADKSLAGLAGGKSRPPVPGVSRWPLART